MMTYTEADVARLADIISEAQKRGIKHGSYTLARWILTAWQVDGSTPLDSPAPERCDAKLSDTNEGDLHCERLEGHDGRHLDSGLTWLGDDPDTIGPLAQLHNGAAPAGEVRSDSADPDMMAAQSWDAHERAGEVVSPARVGICGDSPPRIFPNTAREFCDLPHGHAGWHEATGLGFGAPPTRWSERVDERPITPESAGEVVSVPPPAPARADEPVPVPPPVDAPEPDPLLLLVAREWVVSRYPYDPTGYVSAEAHVAHIARDARTTAMEAEIRHFWTAGVEEGRRQRDAEIHANVFTSARLVAAEAGFGPAPESVTVSYERRASAYEQGIYDVGVAEGRRQATEERTEGAILGPGFQLPGHRDDCRCETCRPDIYRLPAVDHG